MASEQDTTVAERLRQLNLEDTAGKEEENPSSQDRTIPSPSSGRKPFPNEDIPPPPPTPPQGGARRTSLDATAPSFTPRESPPPPPPPSRRRRQPQANEFSLNAGALYRSVGEIPPAAPRSPPKQRPPKQTILNKDRQIMAAPALPPKQPQPSVKYQLRATERTHLLRKPRPLLVILDLNGTLLYRPKGHKGGSDFQARPHVHDFLDYLFSKHHVMIWSSAMPGNVKGMCQKLLTPAQQEKLIACWARDTLRLSPANYTAKVQVYKQLQWVWNHDAITAANPYHGGSWSQDNTVLIDDSKLKAASEPSNLIQIEEFEGTDSQMQSDVLGQVVEYLERLRWWENVSSYMRQVPFLYHAPTKFDWTSIRKDAN